MRDLLRERQEYCLGNIEFKVNINWLGEEPRKAIIAFRLLGRIHSRT